MANATVKAKRPFLPTDYDIPTESNYMKFEKGENQFRILSEPVMGWEWWLDKPEGGRTPKRIRMGEPLPVLSYDDDNKPKHFWAMIVWNYSAKRVQILEITQKSIQKAITNLQGNAKWGSPYDYDLVVTREGDKLQTEYTVVPDPKSDLKPEIDKAFQDTEIHLENLFEGLDPFKPVEEIDMSDLPHD